MHTKILPPFEVYRLAHRFLKIFSHPLIAMVVSSLKLDHVPVIVDTRGLGWDDLQVC